MGVVPLNRKQNQLRNSANMTVIFTAIGKVELLRWLVVIGVTNF